ncbi:probable outer membrane protein PmpF [Dysidea avara]|uniref:probable outer membrane protein PmpF n=1 Tax=Dysidea avara TaxID=196820 RepID=UPI00331AEFA8
MILQNLENITITGQGNPTVNCNGVGGIKFDSCSHVTIKGVSFKRCGRRSAYPGIEFYHSSNVIFDSCSFCYSIRRAVVLSKVSGKVYINNCHPEQGTQVQVVINNCNFALNGPTRSVVHIGDSNNVTDGPRCISLLQNSTFIQNRGVPIYVLHTSLILNNSVSFKDNKATAGGGIYSNNSIIKFNDKCNVSFYNNSVRTNGGAIYQIISKIFFKMNAAVTFRINSAVQSGGAIFSAAISSISFEDESIATFNGNSAAESRGGAVYSRHNSCTSFDDYSRVTFYNNRALGGSGGAVGCTINSCVLFGGNSKVSFNNNKAKWGGAVVGTFNSNISFDGFSKAEFGENKAAHTGGAVQCNANSSILFGGH